MGQLPKYKMEEAKRAKREAKLDKRRKENTRTVNIRILIVCEGQKTEPNYFKSKAKDKYSDVIDVDVEGEGRGTVSLVNKTIEIRDKSDKDYDRVWAVFDKDSFLDFNDAIKLAEKNDILCAWSNESFELWYCLHFCYLDTGVSRHQYIEILENEIKKITNDKKYKYRKNDVEMYSRLKELGNEKQAIESAKKLKKIHTSKNYDKHNPCTMVYKLVEELNNPEKLIYK